MALIDRMKSKYRVAHGTAPYPARVAPYGLLKTVRPTSTAAESKAKPKPEPKPEPKIEPKVELKADLKVGPQVESKVEHPELKASFPTERVSPVPTPETGRTNDAGSVKVLSEAEVSTAGKTESRRLITNPWAFTATAWLPVVISWLPILANGLKYLLRRIVPLIELGQSVLIQLSLFVESFIGEAWQAISSRSEAIITHVYSKLIEGVLHWPYGLYDATVYSLQQLPSLLHRGILLIGNLLVPISKLIKSGSRSYTPFKSLFTVGRVPPPIVSAASTSSLSRIVARAMQYSLPSEISKVLLVGGVIAVVLGGIHMCRYPTLY